MQIDLILEVWFKVLVWQISVSRFYSLKHSALPLPPNKKRDNLPLHENTRNGGEGLRGWEKGWNGIGP